MKNNGHGALIGGSCIFKAAEWHNRVIVVARGVRNAVFLELEESISIWLHLMNSSMKENMNDRQWRRPSCRYQQSELIFRACLVKIGEIDADLPIFLLYNHNIGESGQMFYRLDKTNVEELLDFLLY